MRLWHNSCPVFLAAAGALRGCAEEPAVGALAGRALAWQRSFSTARGQPCSRTPERPDRWSTVRTAPGTAAAGPWEPQCCCQCVCPGTSRDQRCDAKRHPAPRRGRGEGSVLLQPDLKQQLCKVKPARAECSWDGEEGPDASSSSCLMEILLQKDVANEREGSVAALKLCLLSESVCWCCSFTSLQPELETEMQWD